MVWNVGTTEGDLYEIRIMEMVIGIKMVGYGNSEVYEIIGMEDHTLGMNLGFVEWSISKVGMDISREWPKTDCLRRDVVVVEEKYLHHSLDYKNKWKHHYHPTHHQHLAFLWPWHDHSINAFSCRPWSIPFHTVSQKRITGIVNFIQHLACCTSSGNCLYCICVLKTKFYY